MPAIRRRGTARREEGPAAGWPLVTMRRACGQADHETRPVVDEGDALLTEAAASFAQ